MQVYFWSTLSVLIVYSQKITLDSESTSTFLYRAVSLKNVFLFSLLYLWLRFYFKVLEFVDEHGNEVLNLGSFTLLPDHVVRLILARDELQADEFTKFQAALMWGKY